MPSFSIPLRRANSAFTIVELLVAVAVTAVLVTFMVTVTSNVLSAWNRSSGILSSGNQARTILDQISQDLEGAIIKRGTDVMFAATVQETPVVNSWVSDGFQKPSSNESLRIEPTTRNLSEYRFGQAGVWLRFFTTPSDNNPDSSGQVPLSNISAPRAVAYQISRINVGGGQYSYMLYRSEIPPDQVFSVGYDLSTSYSNSVIRNPTKQWIIGNDVIDFGVRLYARNSSGGLDLLFPTPAAGGTDYAANSTSGYPAVAEVFLRILTPEGVRQLAALDSGAPLTGSWWEIAEQNSQVYTRRIEIKSKGL
jgi:type II secretory pathway pseudopilin PulG